MLVAALTSEALTCLRPWLAAGATVLACVCGWASASPARRTPVPGMHGKTVELECPHSQRVADGVPVRGERQPQHQHDRSLTGVPWQSVTLPAAPESISVVTLWRAIREDGRLPWKPQRDGKQAAGVADGMAVRQSASRYSGINSGRRAVVLSMSCNRSGEGDSRSDAPWRARRKMCARSPVSHRTAARRCAVSLMVVQDRMPAGMRPE